MTAVIFNTFTETDLIEHFQVKERALADSLGLKQLTLSNKFCLLLLEFLLDRFNRPENLRSRRDVVRGRVNRESIHFLTHLSGQRVKEIHCLDFIIKKLDSKRHFGMLGRENVDRIASDTESSAREFHIISIVLNTHQVGDQVSLLDLFADFEDEAHLRI